MLITITSKKLDLRDRQKVFEFFQKKKPLYVINEAAKVVAASVIGNIFFDRFNLLRLS